MKILFVILCLSAQSVVFGQLLFSDNFNYVGGTSLVGQGDWLEGYSGVDIVSVGSSGLNYSGYANSGIGNGIDIPGGGTLQIPYHPFADQYAGDVYLSFLCSVSNTNANEGQVIGLATGSGGNFRALVAIKIENGSVYFGERATFSGATSFGSRAYLPNTPYLIVLKYSFIDGPDNDEVRLYVFQSSIPETEPAITHAGPSVTPADGFPLASVFLMGGSTTSSGSPLTGTTITIDGIRISTSWNSAPLPVVLVSFTATSSQTSAELKWSTATEINNFGFEIERRAMNNQQLSIRNWSTAGFVEGNGTTNAPKEYSFMDRNCFPGKYLYRLKQVDRDGQFEYSPSVEVIVSATPAEFTIDQNYPNPFNPTTTLGFTLHTAGMTTLIVFDALGREVAVLVNENLEAGVYHHRTLDAKDLAGGIYFARLTSGEKSQVMKLLLVK